MIWLTWRQFRVQAVTGIAALAAFAIPLVIAGPHLAAQYAASGIGSCHGSSCGQLASTFLSQLGGPYPFLYLLGVAAIILVPAVIGIFWGAGLDLMLAMERPRAIAGWVPPRCRPWPYG
jgi:hypothetical protein